MALQPTDINLGIPARGPKGDKCDKGDKGDKGDQGLQGIQGVAGPQGKDGPQGIQGPPGKPFSIKKAYRSKADMNANFTNDLTDGDFCIIASNVEDEDNADLFVRVGASMQLIADLSGATGIQGPRGPQGIQGKQGPQGNVGSQGPKGDTGKSAYQVWLDAGHSGTETEFINSLKGAKGDTGSQGPIGATGDRGPVGPQGPKGDKGDTGATGQQGPQGLKGDTGATGQSAYQIWLANNHTGTESDFLNSLKGVKGDQGNVGPQGPKGDKGDTGATGSQGPRGPIGATGEQGPVGPQGPKGDQGPRGIQGISYEPYISKDGNWHLKKVENATEPDVDTGTKATNNIDTSDEFTVKKPSEYSEGFSHELKEVFELIPDRSNLDSTAQDGFQAIVTTEVCKGYARQTVKVIDSERPLTFIRNGTGSTWYPFEQINTWSV